MTPLGLPGLVDFLLLLLPLSLPVFPFRVVAGRRKLFLALWSSTQHTLCQQQAARVRVVSGLLLLLSQESPPAVVAPSPRPEARGLGTARDCASTPHSTQWLAACVRLTFRRIISIQRARGPLNTTCT